MKQILLYLSTQNKQPAGVSAAATTTAVAVVVVAAVVTSYTNVTININYHNTTIFSK